MCSEKDRSLVSWWSLSRPIQASPGRYSMNARQCLFVLKFTVGWKSLLVFRKGFVEEIGRVADLLADQHDNWKNQKKMPQSKAINLPLTWICSQLFCSFLDLWRWWWLLRLDYFYFSSQLVQLLSLFFPQESIVCFKLLNQFCVLFDQMCVVVPVEMDVLQKLILRNLRKKSLQLSQILFPLSQFLEEPK